MRDGDAEIDAEIETLALPAGIGPSTLVVADGFLYWADHNGICHSNASKICRVSLATLPNPTPSDVTCPVTGIGHPFGIAVTGSQIYFTEYSTAAPPTTNTGRVSRANLDGSDYTPLVTGLDLLGGVALDLSDGKMYWTVHNIVPGARIQRANLDGTGVEDLVCSVTGPFNIALDLSVGACASCCGDGQLNTCEQCDDGNTTNGDGCSSTCQSEFIRADSNADGKVDISDPIATLSWLFLGAIEPPCLDAADANDDGAVDISDSVFTLGYLFLGFGPPPAPGPAPCGADPTPDSLSACLYPAAKC